MGQVDDLGSLPPQSFFFSDWCTSIKRKVLLFHFNFLCQVPVVSSPPVFSLHSLCTSLIYHFICGAVAILLHLAFLLGCHLGVHDEMASGHSTKKYTGSWRKKNPLRSFSLSLPQNTFRHVSERAHAHTRTHTRVFAACFI